MTLEEENQLAQEIREAGHAREVLENVAAPDANRAANLVRGEAL